MEFAGQRFGKLVVVEQRGVDRHHNRRYLCLCDCGGAAVVLMTSLRRGNTKSCGCVKKTVLGESNKTHGASGTKAHTSWWNMKSRCERQKSKYFADYGGRGIKVCERWQLFANFLEDMGQPPEGFTLERIDNNKGYEPGNVVWADRKRQANNRRSSRFIEHNGQRLTLQQWSELTGIGRSTIAHRIKAGWPLEQALSP